MIKEEVKEKEEPIQIKIKKEYQKSDEFKTYYVTGAFGGFKNEYDFRLTFFNIDSNELFIKAEMVKGEDDISKEDFKEKVSQYKMSHNLLCELIMTERAAKELYRFLRKEIHLLETRRQKKREETIKK